MNGVSHARNSGLDIATGQYICFIDPDDYVELNFIEELYKAVKENNTKMAQCNIVKIKSDGNEIGKLGYQKADIKSGKKLIEEMFEEHSVENVVVWNRIYEKSLFENLRYPVDKIHEDEYITYKILYSLDKVVIVNKYLYYYRKRKESITEAKFSKKRLAAIPAMQERVEFFKKRKEEKLYQLSLENYIYNLRYSYIRTKKYIKNSSTIQKKLKKEYKKQSKIYFKDCNCSLAKKLNIICFIPFPFIYNLKFTIGIWEKKKKEG